MTKKDLTKITDLNSQEISRIIEHAFEFKKKSDAGVHQENILRGKVVAMIFEKPSLRTKVAFETATVYLGGIPIFLSSGQILASGRNIQGRESIPDIAKNLERFADIVLARVYSHSTIQKIATSIEKPVINLLCDQYHPTQALADLMAIIWHKKESCGLNVVFIGDGNNVAVSLMQICALTGMNFTIASPAGYEIPTQERKNPNFKFIKNPIEAVKNADIVYTDTFVSMGQESEREKRLCDFKNYQVNMELLKQAKSDILFMHCLPAHRGEEVTDEVMDCSQSIIFDQAECRLHIAKSLLSLYLNS